MMSMVPIDPVSKRVWKTKGRDFSNRKMMRVVLNETNVAA